MYWLCFFISKFNLGKNVIIFEVDMISSVHIDINKKDILILVKGSTQVLDYTTSTVEAQYSISFSRSNITFCLSFHYNGRNSFFLLILQNYITSKQKILKLNKYLLCY